MLQPIIQRPNDLRLAIIQQPPLPTLKALKTHELRLKGWALRFCIIGESHQVQVWRNNTLQFVELLACVDFPAGQCSHYHPFELLKAHHYRMAAYDVQVEFSRRPRPRPRCDALLHYAFPASKGVLPITEIRWWRRGDALHWWTLHTYPQAAGTTYVYSQSMLKIE